MVEVTRRARRLSTYLCSIWILARSLFAMCRRFDPQQARFMVLALPVLHSLPGAPVCIYLDFDGHVQKSWGTYSNIVTPPYDRDGDLKSFNQQELDSIHEIWARVAEDFAPFNVNVTTVDPKDYSNGRAVHVVIGGHYADWYRTRVGGVSFANSFVNSMPNVVYVFSRALGGGSPKFVADLVSHEVGHTFGLEEQSVYDESGSRIRDYNTGDAKIWGPLMGNSLAASRSIWHYGTSTSLRSVQDDVAIIARAENGFGLRPDDHPDDVEKARAIRISNDRFQVAGIIGSVRDADCFIFESSGGRIELQVDVNEHGPNLDSRLELRTLDGELVGYDLGDGRLDSKLHATLPAGTYCAVVRSHGSYGDLGQYQLYGTVVDDTAPLAQLAVAKHVEPADDEALENEAAAGDEVVVAPRRVRSSVNIPAAGPATR